MMSRVVPITCCLIIVFTALIDGGNGKWKSKDREQLREDIAKFQEMAEKIEDEIEDIYDEYSDDWDNKEYFSSDEDSLEISDKRSAKNTKNNMKPVSVLNFISNSTSNVSEGNISSATESSLSKNGTPKNTMKIDSTSQNIVHSKWPKFEDMLLDMGKKYDWKNDRWIKVKKKANQSSEDNHLVFRERHKFNYKTVKLNRSKSRRNVVIAVTAVR